MRKVGLFLKPQAPEALATAHQILAWAKAHSVEVVAGWQTPAELGLSPLAAAELSQLDTLVVCGGDGTLLHAAQLVAGTTVPIFAINLGRLGFLTEFDLAQLSAWHQGQLVRQQRPFYQVAWQRAGTTLNTRQFINDVVLQRGAQEHPLTYGAFVEGQFMSSARADGVLVASPTGSTAYNLSAGGPILHPSLAGLVVLPICPHKVSYRPVVLPVCPIQIELRSTRGWLSLDGIPWGEMVKGDTLAITPTPHHLHLWHDPALNFFDLLRHKLGWDTARGPLKPQLG